LIYPIHSGSPFFGYGLCRQFQGVELSQRNSLNFLLVLLSKLLEHGFALWSEAHTHEPAVGGAGHFAHEFGALGPLDEPYNSVMAFLQEFGQLGNGGPAPARKSCDAEKQLVLLGRKAT
jgi:hypothetical protein